MHLALAVADVVVGRSGRRHGVRARRAGHPGRLRPAARRATASSGSTPPRSSPRAAGCSSTTTTSIPPGCSPTCPSCWSGTRPPRPVRAWAAPRRASACATRPPGSPGSSRPSCPRRAQGAQAARGRRSSAGCTSSGSAVRACRRSPPCSPRAGWSVSGSDAADGPALPALREAGVTVHVGHDAALVDGVDTLVVSSAVRESNPELARARALGIRVLHRSEALAALMVGRDAVAVAGAHGKTTTSAMVATALLDAGADPSFAIGGTVLTADGPLGGSRDGSGPGLRRGGRRVRRLVPRVRAAGRRRDERRARPPRPLRLRGGVRGRVRGVRRAHPARAARSWRAPTTRVRCASSTAPAPSWPRATSTSSPTARRRRRTSWWATCDPTAPAWSVDLTTPDGVLTVRLAVPGVHNALNAGGAWAAVRRLGTDPVAAATGLGGVPRDRSPVRGPGDRGRRPRGRRLRPPPDGGRRAAPAGALGRRRRAACSSCSSRTSTRAPARSPTEFGAAFDLADVVVVTDVYAAREDPDPDVTGALIVDRVPTAGQGDLRPGPPRRRPRRRAGRPARATCCSPSAPATSRSWRRSSLDELAGEPA